MKKYSCVTIIIVVFVTLISLSVLLNSTFRSSQVVEEILINNTIVVQRHQLSEINGWFIIFPPQRYQFLFNKNVKAQYLFPYPGRYVVYNYPYVASHPDPEVADEINANIQSTLFFDRDTGRDAFEGSIYIDFHQIEHYLLLRFHRSYYPFFAVSPMKDAFSFSFDLYTGAFSY